MNRIPPRRTPRTLGESSSRRSVISVVDFQSAPVRRRGEGGSIVVGLLWCLALLSVLVIGLLHTARMDLQLARNYTDRIQARYLAVAGIERAKALLFQDARDRRGAAVSHTGTLFNDPGRFRDVPLGRGTYRVFRGGREDEGGGVIYGVSDEESRLHLNVVQSEELQRLEGMTPDFLAAFLDWRDNDRLASPGGAEEDHYLSLRPPSLPRDGPLLSVREFLMIRGAPASRFFGGDPHGTGLGSDEDDEMDGGGEPRGPAGGAAPGWNSWFTVHSGVENVTASGQDRVDIQSADETELTGVRGITSDIARAIVAHRGRNQFNSIADLLDVPRAPPPGQEGGRPPGGVPGRPGGDSGAPGGPKVIDSNLLLDIADGLYVAGSGGGNAQEGVVNVNTAGFDVLVCLPGMTRELAQAVISFRASNGYLANIAWLLRVPGITPEIFKQLAPRVTVRSETFRVLAEGRVRSSGVRQRVQAIVRVGTSDVETLGYRETDL